MKSKNHKSFLDLILYILSFLLQSKKIDKTKLDNSTKKIKNQYQQIDREYDAKKDEDVADRLNNMFN